MDDREPEPNWEGHEGVWEGVLILEVQAQYRTTAGREKHIDPREQGSALAELVIERVIRTGSESAESYGTVRMVDWREEKWMDPDAVDWNEPHGNGA